MSRRAAISLMRQLGRATAFIALASGALFGPAAGAQTAYSINSLSPTQLPAGNPAVTLTVNVATGSSAFNVCFFTGYGASGTPLVPTTSSSTGNGYIVTVNVPASSIQQIPASAYSGSNPPSFAASVYAQDASASSCTQTNPDGSAAVTLNFPTINGLSLANVPDQNPNLPGRIPSNLNLSGTNFVPNAGGASSTVTYVGGSTTDSSVPTLFVKSTELRSNLPTNIPPGSGTLNVTECNQSAGNSYCSSAEQVSLYALGTNAGTLTATPNPPSAGQATSFTADFGPPQAIASYGAPGGLVTFSEGNTSLGTAPLILDPTAQLAQIQVDRNNSAAFNSTATSLIPFIADFNNDGVQDSMYLDPAASTFHILLGVAPYAYDQPIVPANNSCTSIPAAAIGDFNNDGVPDISYLCQVNGVRQAFIMLGQGDGSTFSTPVQVASGTASAIAAGDFNHDGKLDLVLLTTGGEGTQVSFTVYLGDGTGNFIVQDTSGPFAAAPLQTAGTPNQFLGADLNGDGATDLVLLASAGVSGPGVYVFQNVKDGNSNYGSFASPLQPINGNYTQVVVTPLDAPASSSTQCTYSCTLPSLIAISPTQLLTAVSTSTGSTVSFSDTLEATTIAASSVAAGDFNGDGLIDVAVVGQTGIEVLTGDGAGGFSSSTYTALTDPSAATNGLLIGAQDENGDGFADLFVLNPQLNQCEASPCPISYSELTYFTAGTSSATFADQTGFSPGAHTITASTPGTYTIAGGSAATSFTIVVVSATLASVTPNTASLGDPDKPVVLTGTGFLTNSSVLVNGTPVATTYVSSTSLQATIPASNFLLVQTLQVAVSDTAAAAVSNALPISVTAPPVLVQISGPTTTQVGEEPQILFTLEKPYPVAITGSFTLTFAPANGSPDDPMFRFATPGTNTSDPSGRTFGFTIPANSTVTPTVLLQSGSTSGVATINLVLFAGGANITPSSVQPLAITEPDQVPGVISTSLSAQGKTLTVVVSGYSNTREALQANFHFDAAPGHSIKTQNLQIDDTALFAQYYASAISDQYGSTFIYTQTFTLDEDATVVGAVQVTLTNSVGVSAAGSSQ